MKTQWTLIYDMFWAMHGWWIEIGYEEAPSAVLR